MEKQITTEMRAEIRKAIRGIICRENWETVKETWPPELVPAVSAALAETDDEDEDCYHEHQEKIAKILAYGFKTICIAGSPSGAVIVDLEHDPRFLARQRHYDETR